MNRRRGVLQIDACLKEIRRTTVATVMSWLLPTLEARRRQSLLLIFNWRAGQDNKPKGRRVRIIIMRREEIKRFWLYSRVVVSAATAEIPSDWPSGSTQETNRIFYGENENRGIRTSRQRSTVELKYHFFFSFQSVIKLVTDKIE